MIYQICPSCNLPRGVLASRTSAMMNVCRCEPYSPVMDRGHPDTASTEIKRLIDLVEVQTREIAAFKRAARNDEHFRNLWHLRGDEVHALQAEISALKRAARERDLELLSDATQYQCMLEAKDADIAKLLAQRQSLAEDFREYLYRVASQVPFEHQEWANQRGAPLLAALKGLQ